MYYITAKVKDEDDENFLQCYLAYDTKTTTNFWSTWNIQLFYSEDGARTKIKQISMNNYCCNPNIREQIDINSIEIKEFKDGGTNNG